MKCKSTHVSTRTLTFEEHKCSSRSVLTSTGYKNLEKSHKIKLKQREFQIRLPNIVILKGELLCLLIMHKVLGSVLFPLNHS